MTRDITYRPIWFRFVFQKIFSTHLLLLIFPWKSEILSTKKCSMYMLAFSISVISPDSIEKSGYPWEGALSSIAISCSATWLNLTSFSSLCNIARCNFLSRSRPNDILRVSWLQTRGLESFMFLIRFSFKNLSEMRRKFDILWIICMCFYGNHALIYNYNYYSHNLLVPLYKVYKFINIFAHFIC